VPFTGSHPAAVLPLLRLGLVPAAAVIGSLVPDLPYYAPVPVDAGVTHSPAGVPGADLAAGVVLYLLWRAVVAPFLLAAAPPPVRDRVPAEPVRPAGVPLRVRRAVLVAGSVLAGAGTHVGWDAFTHRDRRGATHLAWLAAPYAGLAGYRWAQYASGLVGAAVIVAWLVSWWRRTVPAARDRPRRLPPRRAAALWAVVAVAAVLGAVHGAVAGGAVAGGNRLVHEAVLAGTHGTGAGAAALLACAIGWAAVTRTGPAGSRYGVTVPDDRPVPVRSTGSRAGTGPVRHADVPGTGDES